ncbi:hypothetical protein [Sanguibacter sp. HDW7]|uniref:hypothetical protein n=1 Tax=Sanguibacter sp. HDW7 TaxID=2714931 RepID=UPI001407A73E|nr:hypothetical protein [Sanguibacter sp. HDW7]QIK82536.1 hypothetical protein G7063_02055 [Sanguibacter sp. HDW7]
MPDHPRHSAAVDLALLEGAVHVWYRERSVLRFRARALLVVGVVLAVLVVGLVVEQLRVPAVLTVVLLAPAAVAAAAVVVRAGDVWGLDEGFALAVRADGLVLPRFGFVPWEQVTGVRVVDDEASGVVPRFQAWLGVRSVRILHVYVDDVAALASRAPARWARQVATDPAARRRGWAFAPEAQVEDGAYAEVLSAVREHAPHLLG